jgi:hypothetical protein
MLLLLDRLDDGLDTLSVPDHCAELLSSDINLNRSPGRFRDVAQHPPHCIEGGLVGADDLKIVHELRIG